MDEDTEVACWAHQAELEERQRQEWDALLQRDPAFAEWLERFYIIYTAQEQDYEHQHA